MMQSCEGAMKSLRSDACSAGENLLDDISGRPEALQSIPGVFDCLCRHRNQRNQSVTV
uniref:Uncharacterized protein n=1 Tax=Arundo donax TaxID=35708 RepID=A0A0A9F682_ARUDO